MNKFLLIILFSFGLYGLKAQGNFYLGGVAGYQINSSYIEHTVYTVEFISQNTYGFTGGLIGQYLSPYKKGKLNTGFQVGVKYNQRGWEQLFLQQDTTVSNSKPFRDTRITRLGFLTIPIETLLLMGTENTRFYGSIGMYLDFLLNYKSAKGPDPDYKFFGDFYTYNADRDRHFGYGLRGTLGIQKEFSFGVIQLESHFSYSISNLIGFESRASDTPDVSNLWSVGGTIGYLIHVRNRE